MIKRNTQIDQKKRACNETETDVWVSTAERETDGGERGRQHTHTKTHTYEP